MLHPEKTRIVHIRDGFDFLGFNIRQYRGVCLVKPQKKKVLALLERVRLWLRKHPEVTPDVAIRYLNPILRGWAMYYRHAPVSKATFDYVRHQGLDGNLALVPFVVTQRNPINGSRRSISKTHRGRDWRFHAKVMTDEGELIEDFLMDVSEVIIQPLRQGAA